MDNLVKRPQRGGGQTGAHHADPLGVCLHTFHRSTNDFASGGLIRLVQALLHPLRKRLQMTNAQPQLLVLQRPARLFLRLSPPRS
jgi:hypothetical protein